MTVMNDEGVFYELVRFLMISSVYLEQRDFPPRSPVSTTPSRMVFRTAPSIFPACSDMPRCLSIMTALRRRAVGLALSCPAMSGAVP